MDDTILSVQNISKNYGPVQALQDLTFEVGTGDVLGLLGPNGAGKTTAIRVLTTIFPPSHGGFTLDGTPHTQPRKIRKKIGVLPESTGYPLQITGEEYLVFYGRLFGASRTKAQEKANELLTRVGLSEQAANRIATYSRGMRQRLGIARALVNDPRVLFLDEPTLGFDPKGQREVLGIIRNITREMGSSVILSTHFLEAVEHVCSRVIILNKGRVIVDGTVDEIKDHVRIPHTGRFLLQPKMHDAALGIFRKIPGAVEVRPGTAGSGSFLLTFTQGATNLDRTADDGLNEAISSLVDANIPILSFTRESGSLSDAFLEITKEDMR